MKKMRKLIPAFAMLMVAAIMMTTASFAWFTMNNTVTATGMNIQAQASGSLVIKADAGLKENDNKINIDFQNPADVTANYLSVYNLTPVTLVNNNDGTYTWKTAADNSVDVYGASNTDLVTLANPVKGTHYAEYTVYLANAGAALNGQDITATITAPTNGHLAIAPAYTVAFYVNDAAQPSAVLHLDDADHTTDDGENIGKIATNITIPSIVGIAADGEATVGIKITMRVFVDGEATDPTKATYQRAVYTQITAQSDVTTYVDGQTYFDDANGQVETNTTGFTSTTSVIGKYLRTYETVTVENTKYVNTSSAPVYGTTIKVAFGSGATSVVTPDPVDPDVQG